MLKYGRTYLDLNERSILQLEKQMTPGSKRAAMLMFDGPNGAANVEKSEAKDQAVSQMCDILDQFASDPQAAWEAMNSLRILYEFRHDLQCGALKQEPKEKVR